MTCVGIDVRTTAAPSSSRRVMAALATVRLAPPTDTFTWLPGGVVAFADACS